MLLKKSERDLSFRVTSEREKMKAKISEKIQQVSAFPCFFLQRAAGVMNFATVNCQITQTKIIFFQVQKMYYISFYK